MNCWGKLRSLYAYNQKLHPRDSAEIIFVVVFMLTVPDLYN